MSRRRRSVAFLLAALVAAAAAAALADRYGSRVARGYGPLRPVVVTRHDLSGQPIDAEVVSADLVVRRVPERFVPVDALASPAEALGLVVSAPLPAGSYVSASQLRVPRRDLPVGAGIGPRRSPVELIVSGAGALLASGAVSAGTKVDVVVSSEPATGIGRTRVAASAVPLLDLRPGPEGQGPGAAAAATLALTRRQALSLIAAESEARRLTLLPER